jgi:hypothetical protein
MMGLFGPTKGSIGETVKAKVKAGQPHGSGAATQVQARQAKARKKEIQEELARKKQEKKDLARYNLLRTPKTDPAKQKKNKKKAIAAGNKRRAKKEANKEKGFWG